MKVQDLVRRVVVGTNPYWPFSAINRLPYTFALSVAARRLGRLASVRGLYVRNGLARTDWVPGISDIDLTIVIEDAADAAANYAAVRAIWAEYGRLKRLFPMLGEMDVLSERALRAWSAFGMPGRETASWKCLIGAAIGPRHEDDPLRLRFDACNHAFLCYFEFLLKRLFDGDAPAVSAAASERLAAKIERYAALGKGERSADVRGDRGPWRSVAASVAIALRALDECVRSADFSVLWADFPTAHLAIDGAESELPAARPTDLRSEHKRVAERLTGRVEAVVWAEPTTLVLVNRNVDGARLDEIARAFSDSETRPLIVTPAVFEYAVRYFDPYLYTHLLRCGAVTVGQIGLPPPPDRRAFAWSVLSQSPNVHLFPRSRDLVPPFDAHFAGGRLLGLAVERALFAKMILEHGLVTPWHDCLIVESHRLYGDVVARAEAIRSRAAEGGTGFAAFALLRDLSDDLIRGEEASTGPGRLFRRASG